MASQDLIDAQFDRAVEIVQGLPKTGPVQTTYEEKLAMYSLYKQATVGNVKAPRPGIWDMLGRAKWDAWDKQKDLEPYEAKWLYVDALLKVLRKYSDKTIARVLAQELEAYGGDPSNLVMSRSLSKSTGSGSSGSTASNELDQRGRLPPIQREEHVARDAEVSSEDEVEDDGVLPELPMVVDPNQLHNRPQSSLSSQRYRTPMAGSLAMSPPPHMDIPASQPMPGFETPSAFAEHGPASIPSSLYPTGSSYVGQYSELSHGDMGSSPPIYPSHPHYRGVNAPMPMTQFGSTSRPASRPTLERTIENVQAHLAALHERLDSLESLAGQPPRSNMSLPGSSPGWGGAGTGTGRRSPADGPGEHLEFDLEDLGMWSLVVNPITRTIDFLRHVASFFARNENRSPTLIIVRRLCLDVSFLLCVLAILGTAWRKSGVRRREIRMALKILGRAIVGSNKQRIMVDQGV